MPFMKGSAPIRRTLKYLEAGKLFLKERIQVVSINYNTSGDHHYGARDFVFWYLPQIQYKNPNVQILTVKNTTPTPFMKFYFEGGEKMLVDVDSKNKEDILRHLIEVVGKSKSLLQAEEKAKEKIDNPANLGYHCERHCVCEIPGQVPCPGLVPLPNHMRGKFKYAKE